VTRRIRQFHIDRFDDTLPSRQINAKQVGTSFLWIGRTGQLIQILNPGDPGFEENMKIVDAAMHPNGASK
jgi:hypothetical protein